MTYYSKSNMSCVPSVGCKPLFGLNSTQQCV